MRQSPVILFCPIHNTSCCIAADAMAARAGLTMEVEAGAEVEMEVVVGGRGDVRGVGDVRLIEVESASHSKLL